MQPLEHDQQPEQQPESQPLEKLYIWPKLILGGEILFAILTGRKGDFELRPCHYMDGNELTQALSAPAPMQVMFVQAPFTEWRQSSS